MDQLVAAMEYMGALSRNLIQDYTTWIKRNPNRASDIESSVKIISYLLHGRLKSKSTILPELLYCSSNILAFWHDSLLKAEADRLTAAKASSSGHPLRNGFSNNHVNGGSTQRSRTFGTREVQRIKTLLTILEYFEFFLEVSARQVWGDVGRWIVILIVQAVKACLRTALLYRYKVGMIESPALQPFDRKNNQTITDPATPSPSVAFVLKHSGRVVRKIHASPSILCRNWKLPAVHTSVALPRDLPPLRLIAEIIHILRPLSHLFCLGIWGTVSWKPFLVSLAMDISSLQLHGSPLGLRGREKLELSRRTYALLFYLIRSPFYDRFTKRRILASLMYFGDKIPILGNLFKVIAEAIPQLQDTYSFVWNDV